MSTIDELKKAISETGFTNRNETTQAIIDELDITAIPDDSMEDLYKEMLNQNGEITLGGLKYDVSSTFKAVDPIAYDVGFSNFTAENHEEIFIDGSREPYYVTTEDYDRIDEYEPEDSSE